MFKWQFVIDGTWTDCSEKNNRVLFARFQEPSLEPLYLANIYGELWGCPEKKKMNFRKNDEEEVTYLTFVRRCSVSNCPTIYAIYNNSLRTLLPPSLPLFEERAEEVRPFSQYTAVHIGAELFVAEEHEIFQTIDGKLQKCSWRATGLSNEQFQEMTKTRFAWEFKGPFRNERMAMAVANTSKTVTPSVARQLNRLFSSFCPDDEDATEYGPYQFPDLLCAYGEEELSCQVTDQYHALPLQGWQPFDGITNATIEEQRSAGHNTIVINVRGQEYMVLFDSGGGASGQASVIIRPARYQKILNCIEEQYRAAASQELFELLLERGLNPITFLRASNPEELLAVLDDNGDNNEAVMRVFHKVTHASQYIATRIQQFMPALLEKYKECDIRLSSVEHLAPKNLCKVVARTMETGLAIPESQLQHCATFRELVEFIRTTQSWVVDKTTNGDCHICLTSNCVVLRHCGSATACLKCWVDTLVETKMKCPFCRQSVAAGELVSAKLSRDTKNKESEAVARPLKRRRRFRTAADVLTAIHQENQYSDITLESVNTIQRWFTILVRQKILDISEMPIRDHGVEKTFEYALREFQVL